MMISPSIPASSKSLKARGTKTTFVSFWACERKSCESIKRLNTEYIAGHNWYLVNSESSFGTSLPFKTGRSESWYKKGAHFWVRLKNIKTLANTQFESL
jgi:hypothetical protein